MAVVPLAPLRALPAAPAETRADGVSEFLDGLLELPVASWLRIGRELMADREGLTVRRAAWSELEEAIGMNDLTLAAWNTRDSLDTVVCLVSRTMPRWSRDERCQFAAAHGAAEAVALALRTRAYVRPEVVRALYSPFAAFVNSSSPV